MLAARRSSRPTDSGTVRFFLSFPPLFLLDHFGLTSLKTFLPHFAETSKLHKTDTIFTDATPAKEEVTVSPLETQDAFESRKLWKDVADGIRSGDFDKASNAKTKIEVSQRDMRAKEKESGAEWKLKYFEHVASDPDCTSYHPLALFLLTISC